MAIVGDAYIVIRPITAGFKSAVQKDLKGLDAIAGAAGSRAGKIYGGAFGKAFGPSGTGKYTQEQLKGAEKMGEAYKKLTMLGYYLQAGIGVLGGSIGALAGGLVSLASAFLSAAPASLALAAGLVQVGIGAAVAKLALGGVGQAVSKLNKQKTKAAKDDTAQKRRVYDAEKALALVIERNAEALLKADEEIEDSKKKVTKAQKDLTEAIKDGNEEIQQLGFDAEDAALAEKKAALELEKARENLQRVQDLPPNSRARKEAELAYAEAELNLRRAKDKNADLATEQERLAKTGVEGTDTVIKAREAMNQAEQALADANDARSKEEIEAARKQQDAELDLARAKEDLAKAKKGDGGDDPLAGLTKSQKEFAKFLSGMKPKFDELKEAAAGALLPPLQTAITTIMTDGFPTLKTGIAEVGTALGTAANSFADAFVTKENLDKLGTLFTNTATSIEKLGVIAGSLWGIFLSVLQAVDPLLQNFLDWLQEGTTNLDEKLNADPQKLKDFFAEAERVAKDVGAIIGNIAGGLGNIIKANTGPGTGGQIMLDYFKDITQAFKDFSGTASGQQSLKDYFAGAAENTKAILDSVGGFAKAIIGLGDNPNIKLFWDKIAGAVPAFEKIMTAGIDAAPAMADLLVTLADIIAALADSGGPKLFFEMLNFAAGIIKFIVELPFIKFLLEISSKIHAVVLAVGVMVGSILAVQTLMIAWRMIVVNLGVAIFNLAKQAFSFLGKAIGMVTKAFNILKVAFATNPLGMILVVIGLLVAAFIYLWNTNEDFRNAVMKIWEAIKDAVKAVVDWFIEMAPKIWQGFLDFLKIVWDGIKGVWDLIVAGVKLYIDTVIGVIKFVWDVLKTGLQAVWTGIKFVWDLVVAGVKLYIQTVTNIIKFVWDVLTTALKIVWEAIKIVWDTIVKGVSGFIGLITKALSVIWDFISKGLSTAWGIAKGVWDTIVAFVGGIGAKITTAAKGMWDGLKSGLQGVINFIIGAINWIIRALNKVQFTFPGWVPGVGGKKFGIDIKELAPVQLAAGGIVSPRRGGTFAQIAEAGRPERVEPLDPDGLSKRDKAMIQQLSGGGAGMTINVYPSAGMDETALAEAVSRKIAFMMRKGAIA